MKIIFSPSKEMKVGELNSPFSFSPKFKDESKEILNILKNLDKNQIEKIMKIKGELLEETYSNIINYDSRSDVKAINLYNGVAFKKLEIEQYTSKELEYLNNSLIILSAMYGALNPFDNIKKYRLDMTMKISENSLYSFWSEKVTVYINELLSQDSEKILLNLASNEYSKIINKKTLNFKMVTVDFKEFKNGKYSSVSSFSKQGRGILLDYLIKNQITNIEDIKKFSKEGYSFNSELSNENTIIFSR
ncbi:YaaA family protein [Fusobacterium sp.]|uniref:YaaA family protein n=1 Tax=Fusobacterium sp. TaxID=68766 RepID=UPI002E770472|nr:YaaA family protein [Fusobacterium sp.]MEE1475939.1 YaaA family protein [Fusobacterium sp.]